LAVCVSGTRRRRLTDALGATFCIEIHESFHTLAGSLSTGAPPGMVVVAPRDEHGAPASAMLSEIGGRDTPPLPRVVLYASADELRGGAMATRGVSEVVIADETDAPNMLRVLARRLMMMNAVERVALALRERLSGGVLTIAEAALRNPGCHTVQALAGRIGVHRQTPPMWCRGATALNAEELIVWSRLLLLGAALEETGYSVATLSDELRFTSNVGLRNQVKRYTGVTPQDVRAAGFAWLLEQFDRARAGSAHVLASNDMRVVLSP
jgi:AraC-like DNA-binding protein